ncbi:MAG: efflux RND transporter permease subunit [Bacteroidales bacterium]|nr:efflux RND transporter permease subunit [Bacteroidales bacterium]
MKNREFKLTNFAVDNKLTIYFFTVILVIFGLIAYNSTPKESFPEVVFPYFSVSAIYPGTSPADMENLVTRLIEKQIKSVKGIKNINSNSIQDFSMIFIEFETNIDNKEAYQDIKEAVDKAKRDLPNDLPADPQVMKIDLSEIPVLNINLSGDLGLVQLKEYSEELQDEIESLEEITRVDIVGALEREFQINVDLYKMQATGITFFEIEQKVAFENMTISGGHIDMDGMKRTLRILGEFKNVDDIKDILLKDGIYLKDIAEVVDGFADRESYARLKGEDVITLNVIRKTGKNLIIAIDKIKVILDKYKHKFPKNLIITITGDQSTMTRDNLSNLINTMLLGFMVVVLVLMFFMGVDNSLFVAVAIPLSMLIAFIVINLIGYTMNMVVLMAFILVLGIVVDNSIVVVENIYRHYMNTPNLPIAPACKIGVGEVAGPVFSGTLTTIAPFLPLAFWPGIMGKFMIYIPVTIIITLIASMLVAYMMNPVFAVSFMKYRNKPVKFQKLKKEAIKISIIAIPLALLSYIFKVQFLGNIIVFVLLIFLIVRFIIIPLIKRFQKHFIPWMMRKYENLLSFFLKGKNSYLVLISTILLLFFTFFLIWTMPPKVIFMPEGDPNDIYVYIKMPAGTHIDITNSITKIVEGRVFNIVGKDNPDVESIISNVAVNAGESIFERTTQEKLAKVAISFVEYKDRVGGSTSKYLDKLRDTMQGIVGAEITVAKNNMGPPTGKPINIEISGEHFRKLIPIKNRLESFIDSLNIPGIEELKSDIELHNPELIIDIDRVKANKLGISTAFIGLTLRTALYGKDISKFREGEDEYDIRLRLQKKYRNNLNALLNLKLILPGGRNGDMQEIPISAIADIKYSSSYGGILRKDHKRVITLSSNVLSGYNANEIVGTLKASLKDFELEEGYEMNFTGEQEEQAESSDFLSLAFILAVALILIILVTQFNSISKPLIIILQIIFSLIGVLLGTIIFGIDISVVMTGMGIIAVGGIVVKNAIILIDYTDILIAKGGDKKMAVIKAGATRLTPVILTAASTILGLLPLAIGMNINFVTFFSDLNPHIYFGGDNALFWKPLAWTIIFGLSFATFLTLIVVPSMYYIIFIRKHIDINR